MLSFNCDLGVCYIRSMKLKIFCLIFLTTLTLSGCSNTTRLEQTALPTEMAELSPPVYALSVTRTSKVKTSPQEVVYEAIISNISAEPYITNFALNECTLSDENGSEYSGNMMTETSLSDAVLPGETKVLTVVAQLSVHSDCEYSQDGEKICPKISELAVKKCTSYITTDGTQASNGWGNNAIEVMFPEPTDSEQN